MNHKGFVRLAAVVSASLAWGTLPGLASITTVDVRSQWEAASSNRTLLDFEVPPPGVPSGWCFAPNCYDYFNTGFALLTEEGSVTFRPTFNGSIEGMMTIQNTMDFGSGYYVTSANTAPQDFSTLRVVFPRGYQAAGVDVMYQNGELATFEVRLFSGETLIHTASGTTVPATGSGQQRAFIGFTTTGETIDRLELLPQLQFPNQPRIVVDNLAFGDAGSADPPPPLTSEVPESTTFMLTGIGLIVATQFRRRLCIVRQESRRE